MILENWIQPPHMWSSSPMALEDPCCARTANIWSHILDGIDGAGKKSFIMPLSFVEWPRSLTIICPLCSLDSRGCSSIAAAEFMSWYHLLRNRSWGCGSLSLGFQLFVNLLDSFSCVSHSFDYTIFDIRCQNVGAQNLRFRDTFNYWKIEIYVDCSNAL